MHNIEQELQAMLNRLIESACLDQPLRSSFVVDGGHFLLSITGNRDQWPALCTAAGVPSHAEQEIDEAAPALYCRWPSHADAIFGVGGLLDQHLDSYELRPPQLHMARLVQRAIETRQPAVIEGSTGTGKSFAYAAICMAMGKRVVISTSNKALQMQLYRKDIPFLQQIFPGKKVALGVGKSNYACRHKAEDQMAGIVNIEDPQLREWYLNTESGNTEEINFAADWQDLSQITVDDNCDGKFCPRYLECFYYIAKEARQTADVVITNHMLLCLDQLFPAAGILPSADVLVVDEAHKLADYARTALGVEYTLDSLRRTVEREDEAGYATAQLDAFERDLWRCIQEADDAREIGIKPERKFPEGLQLCEAMRELADEIWPAGALPATPQERRDARKANRIRSAADNVEVMADQTQNGFVRWLEPDLSSMKLTMKSQPFDVSFFIRDLAGIDRTEPTTLAADHTRCARCSRMLTADVVNLLNGQPYGPDCIRKVDLFGDAEQVSLQEWLAADHTPQEPEASYSKPVIFTSATLAAPDLAHFMRNCGIPEALQMQALSPFDYASNALLYVPTGSAPSPRDDDYNEWLCNTLQTLVLASGGGAFLLFTSYRNMRYCADRLRQTFDWRGMPVLVQGELPKLETATRFREAGNAVLFATKSFFEGVSVEGDALRLVVVDKMPFEAPSPLGEAMEENLRAYARDELQLIGNDVQWYPFHNLRVPRMIIELKQATGRLIRTQQDRGVMAILDSRLRSAVYGRKTVLPALPPAPLVARLEEVESFFREAGTPIDDVMEVFVTA